MKDYFGDRMISDLKRPCIITSYDIRNRRAVFFNKIDGVDKPVRNYKVRDVARATAAAPTYFKPARIKSDIDAPLVLVDGGVFANTQHCVPTQRQGYLTLRRKIRLEK